MTETTFNTVDEYIQSFPENVQQIMQTVRQLIHKTVPQVEESISYNMASFKFEGKELVYLAGWKQHLSLYPFSDAMGKAIPESALFKTSGRGTIQFPFDQELPSLLISKIIKIRIKEIQQVDKKTK